MSVWTAASVEDAANNLLEELNSGAMRLCVEHDASDDVAPALLRAARARVEAGSNVRVVCADAVELRAFGRLRPTIRCWARSTWYRCASWPSRF